MFWKSPHSSYQSSAWQVSLAYTEWAQNHRVHVSFQRNNKSKLHYIQLILTPFFRELTQKQSVNSYFMQDNTNTHTSIFSITTLTKSWYFAQCGLLNVMILIHVITYVTLLTEQSTFFARSKTQYLTRKSSDMSNIMFSDTAKPAWKQESSPLRVFYEIR